MKSINSAIKEIIEKAGISDLVFNRGASEMEIIDVKRRCEYSLNCTLPAAYTNMLARHDGFAGEGVFLYSSRPGRLDGSQDTVLDVVDANLAARDVEVLHDFLIFGDSDQDEYVLDLTRQKFQVRDKQAFDNVYEEFDSFDELLMYMLDLMLTRVA